MVLTALIQLSLGNLTCDFRVTFYPCRHFEKLLSQYGGPSLCVDLLGDRDMEPLLSESYIEHLKSLDIPGAAEYVHFDYHQHCRPGHTEALESILLPQCSTFLDTYGHYTNVDGNIVCAQSGILRINCLDCLDRSNNSKAMFGSTVSYLSNYITFIE